MSAASASARAGRPVIESTGLGKDYGKIRAVDAVDITVRHGAAAGGIVQASSPATNSSTSARRLKSHRWVMRTHQPDPYRGTRYDVGNWTRHSDSLAQANPARGGSTDKEVTR
jgi:hypothetical protein